MTINFFNGLSTRVEFLSLLRRVMVIVVAAGGTLVVSLGYAQAEDGPVAVVPELNYNFGTVSQGQKIEHEFVVRNDGDTDLVIQRVAPSCGCTAAAMSAAAIKPGASEKINKSLF
jgi:hypothetical protein